MVLLCCEGRLARRKAEAEEVLHWALHRSFRYTFHILYLLLPFIYFFSLVVRGVLKDGKAEEVQHWPLRCATFHILISYPVRKGRLGLYCESYGYDSLSIYMPVFLPCMLSPSSPLPFILGIMRKEVLCVAEA